MELYSCDQCDYRSYTATVLERHRSAHVDEKPFLCPDCGRAVKNDKQLKEHMKNVHKVGPAGEIIQDNPKVQLLLNFCGHLLANMLTYIYSLTFNFTIVNIVLSV